jgi:hypothetical protein
LIDAVGCGFGAEELAPVGAEAADAFGVEGELADGVKLETGELVRRALGGWVEAADVLDFVAEEVEADGFAFAGRVDVDDAAADGELAGFADGFGAAVASADKEFGEELRVERGTFGDIQRGVAEGAARGDALEDGIRRGEDQAGFGRRGVGEAGQGGGALGDEGGVGRNAVVGEAVPGWEADDLDVGGEEGDRVGEAGETGVVASNVENRAAMLGAAAGEEARVVAVGGAPYGGATSRAGFGTGTVGGGGGAQGWVSFRWAWSSMARSMGVSLSGGTGMRPRSQSTRSASRRFMTCSSASRSGSEKVSMRERT